MKKSLLALPAAGVATVLAGGLGGRRLVEKWAKNPDPLDGSPAQFPRSERRAVSLDDGAEIVTWFLGSGPTIVLVHGLTSSHHDWAPIASSLVEAGYRVVAIDQRGHGESTEGTAGYGSAQLGADLAEVFTTLDLRDVCLIGHSMGGMAAMAFATGNRSAFEERVNAFVSIASAGATDSVRQSLGLRLGAIKLPERLSSVDSERLRILAGLSVFGKDPSLHMVDESIASFRRCPENVRSAATAALTSHNVLDGLTSVDVPSLVIGAGRDQLIRPGQVEDLHRALPSSELVTYPNAGHMVLWEEHADISSRIHQFLQTAAD